MAGAPERVFRSIALAEATTFLALLVATYVKYSHDEPVGVQILGPVHGLLFVAYVVLAFAVAPREGWSHRVTTLVLIGAVLPFGGYVVERRFVRRPPV